jgi:DNA-directed RNA polymerase subunit RPC12/RpoP
MMAIKMTRQGTLPGERMYKGTCYKCKSEYEAKQADLYYECDYRESGYKAKCLLTGCSTVVDFIPQPLKPTGR